MSNTIDNFFDLGFGEVLGYYLYGQGVISSPLNVGQADLDRATGVISYIRRDGHGEMEYYSPKEHAVETLFMAAETFRAYHAKS